MKTRIFFNFTFFMLAAFASVAQDNSWNWPADPAIRAIAEENNVLYSDYLKQDNFTAAKKPLVWLLVNAPNLNTSIYINGAKVFEGLIDAEKDAAKQLVLQDSLIILYDLRIKYFNDEPAVTDRKAYSSYKYWRDKKDKYQEMLTIFNKAYELNGNKISSYNLLGYMDVVRKNKLNFKNLTDDQVILIYENISDVIDFQMSNEKGDKTRLEKIRENVDKLFVNTVTMSCELIENNFGAKFKANPTDVKMAKNIFKLGYAFKCTDSEIFLQATEFFYSQNPEYGLAKLIAIKFIQKKQYDKAISYLNQAADLTDENIKKAEIYLSTAEVLYNKGQKSSAREYAIKAMSADPSSSKDAYTLIGDMYFTSFEQCKSGENMVKDRGVFIAAYEMYRKAGNTQKMQHAKEQFPSQEDIFTNNMEVGQTISVGCWIGEAVSIQKRD